FFFDQSFIHALRMKYKVHFEQGLDSLTSYYNVFSFVTYLNKIERKFNIKMSNFCIEQNDNEILIKVPEIKLALLYAPKEIRASKERCTVLKSNGFDEIRILFPNFKTDVSFEPFEEYHQNIVSCKSLYETFEQLSENPERLDLPSRMIQNYRHNRKLVTFNKIEEKHAKDLLSIIHFWKIKAQSKGRNYSAIVKDLIYIDFYFDNPENLLGYIFYRGVHPVSFAIVTVLPSGEHTATLLSTKSLNYKSQPGGRNETSVYSLVALSHELNKMNLKYLNLSGGRNVGSSTHQFKSKVSSFQHDCYTYKFKV
ncbi:MAG: hypothetical protein KDC90_00575, partial [Ignavibacteriae bacterium]|nr:hypothetical protein [Ignavibacteriota bacterium]